MKAVCLEEAKEEYDIENFGTPYGISFDKLDDLSIDIVEDKKNDFRIKKVFRDIENYKLEYESMREHFQHSNSSYDRNIKNQCNMVCNILDEVIEIIRKHYGEYIIEEIHKSTIPLQAPEIETEEYSHQEIVAWINKHKKDFKLESQY